jgi:hypothetical protein
MVEVVPRGRTRNVRKPRRRASRASASVSALAMQ